MRDKLQFGMNEKRINEALMIYTKISTMHRLAVALQVTEQQTILITYSRRIIGASVVLQIKKTGTYLRGIFFSAKYHWSEGKQGTNQYRYAEIQVRQLNNPQGMCKKQLFQTENHTVLSFVDKVLRSISIFYLFQCIVRLKDDH